MDSLGYPTILRVYGPPSDTDPPSLMDFSFSPDTVAANGEDSVTVVVRVSDAGAGLWRVQTTFLSPSGQSVYCMGYNLEPPGPGTPTVTCRLAIGLGREVGTWRIYDVYMQDNAGNSGSAFRVHLEARGFPTVLTVTP
jgi:hypothetical protein